VPPAAGEAFDRINALLEDKSLIECVADLAFSERGRLDCIGFNTHGELGAHEQRYPRQADLYVCSTSEAASAPARRYLVLL
jgi:hypothetical protein